MIRRIRTKVKEQGVRSTVREAGALNVLGVVVLVAIAVVALLAARPCFHTVGPSTAATIRVLEQQVDELEVKAAAAMSKENGNLSASVDATGSSMEKDALTEEADDPEDEDEHEHEHESGPDFQQLHHRHGGISSVTRMTSPIKSWLAASLRDQEGSFQKLSLILRYRLVQSLLKHCWYARIQSLPPVGADFKISAPTYPFSTYPQFESYLPENPRGLVQSRLSCRHMIGRWVNLLADQFSELPGTARKELLTMQQKQSAKVTTIQEVSEEMDMEVKDQKNDYVENLEEQKSFHVLENFDTDLLRDQLIGLDKHHGIMADSEIPGQLIWKSLYLPELMTPYDDFVALLNLLDLDDGSLVVDVGAGVGRLGIVIGLHFPLLRYQGFEIVEDRVNSARTAAHQLGIKQSEFINTDVTSGDFLFSSMSQVFYMYDALGIDVLELCLVKIKKVAQQRQVTVIAMKDDFGENVIGNVSLLSMLEVQPWLRYLQDLPSVARYAPYRIYTSEGNGEEDEDEKGKEGDDNDEKGNDGDDNDDENKDEKGKEGDDNDDEVKEVDDKDEKGTDGDDEDEKGKEGDDKDDEVKDGDNKHQNGNNGDDEDEEGRDEEDEDGEGEDGEDEDVVTPFWS